jgi:hypothetical protein
MRILTDINLLKGRGKYQFGAFLQVLILEMKEMDCAGVNLHGDGP